MANQQGADRPDFSNRRVVAKLIDWALLAVIAYGIGMWGQATGFESARNDANECDIFICDYFPFIEAALLFAGTGPTLYFALPELFTGKTLGKLLTGLSTTLDGHSWPDRSWRFLLRGVLSAAWFSIPALAYLFYRLAIPAASSAVGIELTWADGSHPFIDFILQVTATVGPIYQVADLIWLSKSQKHESLTEVITKTRVVYHRTAQPATTTE